MNMARKFRIRALSLRAVMARLEVVARRNPGKAPEIITHIRKLERVAVFVERYATSVGERDLQLDNGAALER